MTSKGWEGGSTRAWRKVRKAVLERDGWTCQVRLPRCLDVADQVHHTLGKAHPAGDDPAYLVAACWRCNQTIGDPQRGRHSEPRPSEAVIIVDLHTL